MTSNLDLSKRDEPTAPDDGQPPRSLPPVIQRRKREPGEIGILIGSHIVLIFWAIIVVLPLVWTFFSATRSTSEIFDGPWTLPSDLWGNISSNFSAALQTPGR